MIPFNAKAVHHRRSRVFPTRVHRHLAALGPALGALAPEGARRRRLRPVDCVENRADAQHCATASWDVSTHTKSDRTCPVDFGAKTKLVEELAEEHPTAFDARARELAYLASVLIAGIAVEDRVLTPEEARAAALATCNLGLELAQGRGEHVRIESEPGLVRLFLVGLRVLSEVPGRVVQAFTSSLEMLRSADSEPLHDWLVEQAEGSVADLHEAVMKRNFAAAREAALVLAFAFDPRICRATVPLLDELPQLAGERGARRWIDSLKALERVGKLLHEVSTNR